ncbi:hypothetical protein QTI24_19380, partial [Variovorax sp. J22P240]|uniref:hypothetical protein n=1 Tax=Variovorax sp. J22P240 TaxID=3053514 RepID=UPI002575CB7C
TPTLIGCIFLTNCAQHFPSCALLAAISEAFDYATFLEEQANFFSSSRFDLHLTSFQKLQRASF